MLLVKTTPIDLSVALPAGTAGLDGFYRPAKGCLQPTQQIDSGAPHQTAARAVRRERLTLAVKPTSTVALILTLALPRSCHTRSLYRDGRGRIKIRVRVRIRVRVGHLFGHPVFGERRAALEEHVPSLRLLHDLVPEHQPPADASCAKCQHLPLQDQSLRGDAGSVASGRDGCVAWTASDPNHGRLLDSDQQLSAQHRGGVSAHSENEGVRTAPTVSDYSIFGSQLATTLAIRDSGQGQTLG